jgi:hypothetical protein
MPQKTKIKIYSRYDLPASEGITFEEETLTQQQFAKDADINNIMRQYSIVDLYNENKEALPQMQFGDFTDVPDLMTAQKMIDKFDYRFSLLPAETREKFSNNSFNLLSELKSGQLSLDNASIFEEMNIIPRSVVETDADASAVKDVESPPSPPKGAPVDDAGA